MHGEIGAHAALSWFGPSNGLLHSPMSRIRRRVHTGAFTGGVMHVCVLVGSGWWICVLCVNILVNVTVLYYTTNSSLCTGEARGMSGVSRATLRNTTFCS